MKSSSRIASPLTVCNHITTKEVAAILVAIYLPWEVQPLAIITVAAPAYLHLSYSGTKVALLETGV